jgi:hypothetical protein
MSPNADVETFDAMGNVASYFSSIDPMPLSLKRRQRGSDFDCFACRKLFPRRLRRRPHYSPRRNLRWHHETFATPSLLSLSPGSNSFSYPDSSRDRGGIGYAILRIVRLVRLVLHFGRRRQELPPT